MSYPDGEGNLIIEMSCDEENDRFNSEAVQTEGLFEQTRGYFEIRCTLNTKSGYRTAFWLMSDAVLSENNGGRDAKKARGTCEVPLYMIISAETGGLTGTPDSADLPDSIM